MNQSLDLERQLRAPCKSCGGPMRLARVDSYPMPRARIEIRTFACDGCGTGLQQVHAINAEALPG